MNIRKEVNEEGTQDQNLAHFVHYLKTLFLNTFRENNVLILN